MTDSELDDLIRQSHSTPEFPGSFQREIWARIAVAEQASWSARRARWSESLFGNLARPAPALATVVMMLLLGAGLGRVFTPSADSANPRAAYLATINPLVAHTDTKTE